MAPLTLRHNHEPLYRVVRAEWAEPLDASHSQSRADQRWNPPDTFPVLYTCCSEGVARTVALDVFRLAGVELDDLTPPMRPQLAEISWRGEVVDVASAVGVAAAGFPPGYPVGVATPETQRAGAEWHAAGNEGVVCRSASLARLGFSTWEGSHERWGEVATFVNNAKRKPRLLQRREDTDWLHAATERLE